MGSRKQIKSFLNNPYCKNSATLPSKSLTKTFLSYFKVSPAPSTKCNLVLSSIINCQLIIGLFERGNKRAPVSTKARNSISDDNISNNNLDDKTLKAFNNRWQRRRLYPNEFSELNSYFRDNSIIFSCKAILQEKSMTSMLN